MSVTNILQAFILIGAAQGALLTISVCKRSTKKNYNWLLGIGLLAVSFRLFIYPFMALSTYPIWDFICGFSLLSLLLVGPSIFLFLKCKTQKTAKIKKWYLLHILPFIIYTLHLLGADFSVPLDYSYATLTSGVVYGTASLLFFSVPKFKNYRAQLYSLSLPLLIIPLAIIGLIDFSNHQLGFHPATIPYIFLTAGFYRMGFKSMTNSQAFFKSLLEYNGYQASIDRSKLEKLIDEIENQKLYLNQNLNLQMLSLHSGLTRHEISDLLNKGLNKTFAEFINNYRIEEAKRLLLNSNYDHLSIAGIGQEAGFKSKSNFNLVFKQITGLTPREFKLNSTEEKSNSVA